MCGFPVVLSEMATAAGNAPGAQPGWGVFSLLWLVGSLCIIIIPQNEAWGKGREGRQEKLNKQKLLRVTNIH